MTHEDIFGFITLIGALAVFGILLWKYSKAKDEAGYYKATYSAALDREEKEKHRKGD